MSREGRRSRAGAGGLQRFHKHTCQHADLRHQSEGSLGAGPDLLRPRESEAAQQLTLAKATPPLRLLARLEASERSFNPQQLDRAFFREFSLGFRGGRTLNGFRLTLVLWPSRGGCS